MSYQASSWALRDAPVGADSTARNILMALAEYADPAGRGAWPSVDTICVLVRKKRRCVLGHLSRLECSGVIRRGDQRLVAHIRADRRPVVWDLCMPLTGESGMSRMRESNILSMVEHDDVQTNAPRDCERGAFQGSYGVHEIAPNKLHENKYKPPIAPQGGKPQLQNPRHTLPTDWTPSLEAITFAHEHGINLERSTTRFCLWAAQGQRLRNWDIRFMLWLQHEKPTNQPTVSKSHTHSWKCEHVNTLLQRDPDDANPDDLACNLAALLNQGKSEREALSQLGLPVDEIGESA